MKRFVVTAVFVAGVFALTGCDTTTNPSNNQGPVPPPVEFDIDFDGTKTKTKTVTATPTVNRPVVPQPAPPRVTQTKQTVQTKKR